MDPYAILISEVMLQQTQVDRVVPKYNAWLKKFSTVQRLAKASLQDVLTLWSGLGYNSRGLRLRTMAQTVVKIHNGKIPTTVEELKALPGIGPYTAAAVATFAYKQRVPVIDTNIRRVIGRIFFGVRGAPTEKLLQEKVADALPTSRPDLWNHALMDLGAMVCVARKPKCEVCPVKNLCRAYPAIVTMPNVTSKKPQPKFESTDRYWRGRILAATLANKKLTPVGLMVYLRQRGKIDRNRMKRLLKDLVAEGLIQQQRGMITLSA